MKTLEWANLIASILILLFAAFLGMKAGEVDNRLDKLEQHQNDGVSITVPAPVTPMPGLSNKVKPF